MIALPLVHKLKAPWVANAFEIIGGGLLGLLAFFWLYGGHILNPTNADWLLLEADPATSFLGWHFFRQSAWSIPLGSLTNYGSDLGTSIVYSDSIPLLAFFFKLFSGWLPAIFQYQGIWIALCLTLQGIFASLCARSITENILLKYLITSFFVVSTIMLFRSKVQHAALLGHWLLLWAIYLYLSSRSPRIRYSWIAIFILTVWVHFYFTVMVLAIWVADVLRSSLLEKFSLKILFLEGISIVFVTVFAMWLVGYFLIATPGAEGLGYYSMNSLSLFDPIDTSFFLKPLPQATNGQYEGYNYLGAGLIILVILTCYETIKKPPAICSVFHHLPLIVIFITLTLLALSNVVTFGAKTLFRFPDVWGSVGATFRSSGRMFWPVYYMLVLVFFSFVLHRIGQIKATTVFGFLLIIQLIDLQPLIANLQNLRSLQWNSLLTHVFWNSNDIQRFKHIIYVPPSATIAEIPEYRKFISMAFFAANHGMTVNSGYFSRPPQNRLRKASREMYASLHTGTLDQKAIYIVPRQALFRQIALVLDKEHAIGQIDGLNIIVPFWFKNQPSLEVPELRPAGWGSVTLPSVQIGQELHFAIGGQGPDYLGDGWSQPEPWGIWTDSDVATLGFNVPNWEQGSIILSMTGEALVAQQHPEAVVDFLANNVHIGTRRFAKGAWDRPLEFEIPASVLSAASGQIIITIRIPNPISPAKLGLSSDGRDLGFALRSLRLSR